MLRRNVLAVVLFVAACSREAAPPPPRLLEQPARRADEILLDVASNGDSLVGRLLPVPPQSDADRVLAVRWLTARGPRAWRFADAEVLEARFIPRSNSLLVLTTQHVLLRVDHPEHEGVELDRSALGPLSIDATGHYAVYTRGEMPDYQVIRTDLRTGSTLELAPELVPAWCPTLTPDGRTVYVVASPSGTPSFYRIDENRRVERWELPAEMPLPTGPSAPVISENRIVYESDGAVHTLRLDGSEHHALQGLSLPIAVAGTSGLLLHDRTQRVSRWTVRALERAQ